MITGTGIFIVCLCKAKKRNKCPVRPITSSMRLAPASDVMIDSTRTAVDKEEKKKMKEKADKSLRISSKKSKKSIWKKKGGSKSSDASQKASKKSKKSKKRSERQPVPKRPQVGAMDDDVKSTQRSGNSDPRGPPKTAAALPQANSVQAKTPKSSPIGTLPSANPSDGPKALSPVKSIPKTPVQSLPLLTPVPESGPSPRSAPVALPNSAESKNIKSMPVF
ncbi:hypothetical protein GCK72_000338 [Caenorhabditis remanei]|uniref:Uncharacterized protein n=1 Tax=Caenorhabditis remanei TaxID=31234 RepID=A0A6A5HPC9_CAERE|nr:hypothetical protein GCK72_000338 [Caenorhabditis remanei]KAF1768526.1 hypothetical protein GCK72_000338 [Caenorhabditis remanei]